MLPAAREDPPFRSSLVTSSFFFRVLTARHRRLLSSSACVFVCISFYLWLHLIIHRPKYTAALALSITHAHTHTLTHTHARTYSSSLYNSLLVFLWLSTAQLLRSLTGSLSAEFPLVLRMTPFLPQSFSFYLVWKLSAVNAEQTCEKIP